MNSRNVTRFSGKGKSLPLNDFDHFVSLDWSQRTMAIGHMTQRSHEPLVFERPSDVRGLRKYLRSLRGRVVFVVEETTTAQWLYLELKDSVERMIICNTYRNRLLGEGPKTDKIDAAKLCMLLRSGLLKEVFHSADRLYELRCLVSAYTDVVRAGVRAKNQRSAVDRSHVENSTHGPFIVEHLDKSIEIYRQTKQEYETKFEQACQRYKQLKLLLEVHGIGTICAVKILATVVDARRFARSGKYLSYCGLVKNQKQSGGRSYGWRNPQYSRILKSVYKTAAMAAISGSNPIREYYESLLTRGVAEHNARHAVARYIARITYGILKTGTHYEPYRWRKDETQNKVA